MVLHIQSVYRSLRLNLACGLDGVVLGMAVLAFERLEDNVAEVGNTKEEEFGNSLYQESVSRYTEVHGRIKHRM